MQEQTKTDGSLALEDKQYRIITIEASEKPLEAKLRVAAYARVSTASGDQMNSFAAQNAYYSALISENERWKMVDMYADAGVTGTSAEKREDFQRLLADCRRGLIDRILVKSISRFARNAKDCLQIVRELKSIGVSVYFEEQRIDTGKMSGELLTAVFAAIAQKESESISGNMRWSYQHRMQEGSFNTCKAPYGYRLVEGKLKIQQDEAEVVRYIFTEYLSGSSMNEIIGNLKETVAPEKTWTRRTVEYILKNERYSGDALLQKKYTTDSLPGKQVYNHGEKAMYFVRQSNEPIISQEMFDKARELRLHRSSKSGAHLRCHPLSRTIVCGCCGTMFRPRNVRNKEYMVCRNHDENKEACSMLPISVIEIERAFYRLYFKLKRHGETILSELLKNLRSFRERRMLWSPDIIKLNKHISNITSQNHALAELKQQGLVDPDIFISQSNELSEKLRAAKLQKERILSAEGDDTIPRTQELIEILGVGPERLDTFDTELFGELIDKIIVESNERLRFRLKNGLELAERIERTIR